MLRVVPLVLACLFAAAPLAYSSRLHEERGGNGVTPDLVWSTPPTLFEPLGAVARNTASGDGRALRLAIRPEVGGVSTTFVGGSTLPIADGRFGADVLVLPPTSPPAPTARRGLAFRIDEASEFGDAYQFVFDLDGSLVFRAFVGGAGMTLRRWTAVEIPGGAPEPFTWHRLEVVASGDRFRFFYDAVELPASPLTDATISAPGRFGFYTFHFTAFAELGVFDDYVVEDLNDLLLSIGSPSDYAARGAHVAVSAAVVNLSGGTLSRNLRLVFVDGAGRETQIATRFASFPDRAAIGRAISLAVPASAALGPARLRLESDGGESAELHLTVTP
jgi:hypothetical protein